LIEALAGSGHTALAPGFVDCVSAHSRFSGELTLLLSGDQPGYSIQQADITNLDLGRITPTSQSIIAGQANVHIDYANFDGQQLQLLKGQLVVGPGRINAQFLNAAQRHLGLIGTPSQVHQVGFDQLLTGFVIQPNKFHWLASIQDAQGVIARRTDTSALPIFNLIRALALQQDDGLPTQISPLVRTAMIWLPLEEMQRSQANELLRVSRR
jgi:hypothetical protein